MVTGGIWVPKIDFDHGCDTLLGLVWRKLALFIPVLLQFCGWHQDLALDLSAWHLSVLTRENKTWNLVTVSNWIVETDIVFSLAPYPLCISGFHYDIFRKRMGRVGGWGRGYSPLQFVASKMTTFAPFLFSNSMSFVPLNLLCKSYACLSAWLIIRYLPSSSKLNWQ